ncbi:MAG: 3-isopropylmalate dehydratase small subunit [Gammaproteobacteria bacterium]|jgi:3-isopropylmalate/(R)-2-methylmalate dehydratase small subunit|nr:3-isopropylmalate dehydratase small subunit [Gammaproteobacteria bacterium]MBT5202129.1 3-isopropylmalate dehydratase small subunit [Gammaproteobacteria bacterium]MBT5600827.1 3-isopropylmalate dehydratase small subunit [Gammaproteobacteria bacterium]MBT6246207.1 3-isopropylmalate dehydratase small subunit [Gammaproteobacteria bacterium]
MEKFLRHQGQVVPLNRANIDTDTIMPKQYLKCINKYGYGDWVFDNWRYLDPGDVNIPTSKRRTNPEFELNSAKYKGATLLLAQKNFGCGSSREHAVWGLRDYGIKVIICPEFPDIFHNNCFANGLLAIELKQEEVDHMFYLAESDNGLMATIDLNTQQVQMNHKTIKFKIDESLRQNLLNGYDNISVTLQQSEKIKAFEHRYFKHRPWLNVDLG